MSSDTFGSYGTGSLSVKPGTGVPRVMVDEPDTQFGFVDDSIGVSKEDKDKTYKDDEGNQYVLVDKKAYNSFLNSQRKVVDDPDGHKYILDVSGFKKWSDRPVSPDQFGKQGMYLVDPPVTSVFRLCIPEELEEYNKLQALTYPDTCPAVLFHNHGSMLKFYKGSYVALVTWSRVWYLLPEPRK